MCQGPHRLFLEVEDLPKRFSLLDLPTLKILNTPSCNFPFLFFYINTRHIITAFSTTKHRIQLIFRTDSEVLRLPILQGSAERLRKRSKSMDAHLLDQMKGDPERFFGMIFLGWNLGLLKGLEGIQFIIYKRQSAIGRKDS